MSTLRELSRFLVARRKYWMIPIFVVMALFGLLVVASQGSPIAPFVYTLF